MFENGHIRLPTIAEKLTLFEYQRVSSAEFVGISIQKTFRQKLWWSPLLNHKNLEIKNFYLLIDSVINRPTYSLVFPMISLIGFPFIYDIFHHTFYPIFFLSASKCSISSFKCWFMPPWKVLNFPWLFSCSLEPLWSNIIWMFPDRLALSCASACGVLTISIRYQSTIVSFS